MEMNRFIQFNKVYLSKCFPENAKIIGWKVEIFLPIPGVQRSREATATNLGGGDNQDGYFSRHTDTTFLLFNLPPASHTTSIYRHNTSV